MAFYALIQLLITDMMKYDSLKRWCKNKVVKQGIKISQDSLEDADSYRFNWAGLNKN